MIGWVHSGWSTRTRSPVGLQDRDYMDPAKRGRRRRNADFNRLLYKPSRQQRGHAVRRTALVVGIAVLAFFGWIAVRTWPGLFDTIVSAAHADDVVMTGKVVGIADGDTLTLLVDHTQHKIRLAQVDAPERAQPWGTRASQALAGKVFRKDVIVRVSESDRYGRLIGKIWLVMCTSVKGWWLMSTIE